MTTRTQGTLAQRLGFGPQRATTKPTTQAKPTPKPQGAKAPRLRDTSSGIDARDLSPADYERRLADFGLSPPGTEHHRLAPPIDPEAQRVARRALERAERRGAREHRHAQEARAAELTATAIDGRSASPDEVRARIAAIGAEPMGLSVHEVGRALDPTKNQNDSDTSRAQLAADREVARAANRAMQLGRPFDARKLSAGEMRALLEMRGAGL